MFEVISERFHLFTVHKLVFASLIICVFVIASEYDFDHDFADGFDSESEPFWSSSNFNRFGSDS